MCMLCTMYLMRLLFVRPDCTETLKRKAERKQFDGLPREAADEFACHGLP